MDEQELRGSYIYVLAALSATLGAVLATHRLVIDVQLLGVLLPLAVAIAAGGPVIMGYNGDSFLAGVLTGILPIAGAYVSVLAWPPFNWRRIETMVATAFYGTGLALPAVSVLFVIGVGLRRDGSLTRQKRQVALRLTAAFVMSVIILGALEIGLLQTYGDQ